MIKTIGYVAAGIFVSAVFGALVYDYASLPLVMQSWGTQECVAVVGDHTGSYGCDNLPPRYRFEWVL